MRTPKPANKDSHCPFQLELIQKHRSRGKDANTTKISGTVSGILRIEVSLKSKREQNKDNEKGYIWELGAIKENALFCFISIFPKHHTQKRTHMN